MSVTMLLMILTGPLCGPANAERADRNKPVNLESDRMTADDARKTAVFDGRAVLTQGTLVIRADRIAVSQDADGFQRGTATGSLATFRQKREGSSEYIDAEAERIEYDGKNDRVELFNRARLRREGGDDVCGNYIAYDAKTENFTVNSGREQAGAAKDRVRAVIMPRNGPATGGTPSAAAATPSAMGPCDPRRN